MDSAQIINDIEQRLRARAFDTFTKDEWRLVILGLIRDTNRMIHPETGNKRAKTEVEALPLMSFHGILPAYRVSDLGELNKEDPEQGGLLTFLSQTLPLSARGTFSEAFTELLQEEGDKHASHTAKGSTVMEYLLSWMGMFNGVVSTETAQSLILNPELKIEFRARIALYMSKQGFMTGLPYDFWKTLESLVEEYPDFLYALILHFGSERGSDHALSLLKSARHQPANLGMMGFALDELFTFRLRLLGGERLRKELHELPQWLRQFLREHIFSMDGRKPLLDALNALNM